MNWSTPTKKTLTDKLYPWLMLGLMTAMGAIIFTAAMLIHEARAEDIDDAPPPARVRFQPWQEAWQCNDLRVTVTSPAPGIINYDIAGTIWGGINFTFNGPQHQLYKGAWPCVFVR
jgi:hypothetical protein